MVNIKFQAKSAPDAILHNTGLKKKKKTILPSDLRWHIHHSSAIGNVATHDSQKWIQTTSGNTVPF